MPGGYLGVDIFFVISGYLITTLLVTELTQTGRVSFLNFYERRARRLLPGLLVVMLASLPFAWKYLLPEQLVGFSKSLIFSLFFSSNFYWNFSLQQYGAESALLQPFLHTWSLAVEEQYYIVFPLLLFAIYKWAKQYLASILAMILVLSLLFAQWMTERDASFSFYMIPTRFWELLAGSLLALVMLKGFAVSPNSVWQKAMPSLGLLMIIGSLASFGFHIHHPGFITLIPVVGTVLIICFKSEGEWVTRVLSWRPMVYFGLLSYSLYLWHYPIFAFGRMADIAPSLVHKGIWIVLTLFLSTMSYHLIEKPFRSKKDSRRTLFTVLLLAFSLVIGVSFYWISAAGIPDRGDYVHGLMRSVMNPRVEKNGRNCNSGATPEEQFPLSESCVFEEFPGSATLVLVGDSHAQVLAASVKALAHTNHLNFVQISQSGCPHIRGEYSSQLCHERSEALRSFLKELSNPTIIYSARILSYLEDDWVDYRAIGQEGSNTSRNNEQGSNRRSRRTDHLTSTLRSWLDDGYTLVIVYPVPESEKSVFVSLIWNPVPITTAEQVPELSTSYKAFKSNVASSYAALDQVESPNVLRVFPEKLFCREPSGKCYSAESDRLYFSDKSHVTGLAADLIVREVAAELELHVPDSFRK